MMHGIRAGLVLSAFAGLFLPCAVTPCRADDGPTLLPPVATAQAPPPGPATSEMLPAPIRVQESPAAFVLPPPPNYSVA